MSGPVFHEMTEGIAFQTWVGLSLHRAVVITSQPVSHLVLISDNPTTEDELENMSWL